MKRYIIAVLLLAFSATGLYGQQKTTAEKREARAQKDASWHKSAKYAFGIHTGVDLGAAVPYPWGSMGTSHMNAVPKLNPGVGVSFTTYPVDRFTGTVEVTYKQVGIDAKARVKGQKFKEVGSDDVVEFIGTARVKMAFSMLEVPFYVGYSFGDGRNRVFLGGYYSRIFRSEFSTKPIKGAVWDVKNNSLVTEVSPDNPVGPEVMPPFDDYLDKWDAGMLVGYEWQVYPRINLSTRVSMGFKDIFKKGENRLDYKMLHMRGTVSLSYSFLRYMK